MKSVFDKIYLIKDNHMLLSLIKDFYLKQENGGEKVWVDNCYNKDVNYHYESHAMLYNTADKDYKYKNKRLDIYNMIAEDINDIQKGCTASDIKKKLNGLRSQYLAEKMKIMNSKKSGQNGSAVYIPTAYWYPMLSFLEPSTTADKSISNLDNVEMVPPDEDVEETAMPVLENSDPCPSTSNVERTPSTLQSPSCFTTPPRKKPKYSHDSLLLQASNTMTEMSKLATQN